MGGFLDCSKVNKLGNCFHPLERNRLGPIYTTSHLTTSHQHIHFHMHS